VGATVTGAETLVVVVEAMDGGIVVALICVTDAVVAVTDDVSGVLTKAGELGAVAGRVVITPTPIIAAAIAAILLGINHRVRRLPDRSCTNAGNSS
jgi:hypothetical protein